MAERLQDYLKPGRYAWSDAYDNSPHRDDPECCIVCGKIANGNWIGVILGKGGDVLIEPKDDEWYAANDNGYMGHWIVGPECGKKVPAKYRTN